MDSPGFMAMMALLFMNAHPLIINANRSGDVRAAIWDYFLLNLQTLLINLGHA